MTATPTPVAVTIDVAASLSDSGVPARLDVVDGDAYVRLHLTHDGTTTAWVTLDDPTYAIVRDHPGAPCRIEQSGPLERGWEPCGGVDCLSLALWEWALRTRARSVGA